MKLNSNKAKWSPRWSILYSSSRKGKSGLARYAYGLGEGRMGGSLDLQWNWVTAHCCTIHPQLNLTQSYYFCTSTADKSSEKKKCISAVWSLWIHDNNSVLPGYYHTCLSHLLLFLLGTHSTLSSLCKSLSFSSSKLSVDGLHLMSK